MDNQITISGTKSGSTQADAVSFGRGDRAWAQRVLTNALIKLERECLRNGDAALYTELLPIIFIDETLSSCQASAARLGMTTCGVMTAIQRIRAKLKILIRDEFQQTAPNDKVHQVTDPQFAR